MIEINGNDTGRCWCFDHIRGVEATAQAYFNDGPVNFQLIKDQERSTDDNLEKTQFYRAVISYPFDFAYFFIEERVAYGKTVDNDPFVYRA